MTTTNTHEHYEPDLSQERADLFAAAQAKERAKREQEWRAGQPDEVLAVIDRVRAFAQKQVKRAGKSKSKRTELVVEGRRMSETAQRYVTSQLCRPPQAERLAAWGAAYLDSAAGKPLHQSYLRRLAEVRGEVVQ